MTPQNVLPSTLQAPTFTLVIPTKGSPELLERCVQYYQGWPIPILVADTGKHSLAHLFENKPWFRYLHLPDMPYGEQISTAISQVETPHVQLIANDDFFLFEGLSELAIFLSWNPHIGAVRGRSMVLCHRGAEIEYREAHSYIDAERFNRNGLDPIARLTGCWQIDWTYAMMRTSLAQLVYGEGDIPFGFGYLFEQAMEFKLLAASAVQLLPRLTQIRYRNTNESIVPSHAPAYAEALESPQDQQDARHLEGLLLSYLFRFQIAQPGEVLGRCLDFYRNQPSYPVLSQPVFTTIWPHDAPRPTITTVFENENLGAWTRAMDLPLVCRLEQLVRFSKE